MAAALAATAALAVAAALPAHGPVAVVVTVPGASGAEGYVELAVTGPGFFATSTTGLRGQGRAPRGCPRG